METLLIVAGVAVALMNIVTGFLVPSFPTVIAALINAAYTAALVFGLVRILNNQNRMMEMIERMSAHVQGTAKEYRCERCHREIAREADMCPHCGWRKG